MKKVWQNFRNVERVFDQLRAIAPAGHAIDAIRRLGSAFLLAVDKALQPLRVSSIYFDVKQELK